MYRIKTFNKISPVGLNRFGPGAATPSPMRRPRRTAFWSAPPSCWTTSFPKNLLAISRAGAGVNNIPLDRCSEQGIVVFNTPGANANAVKELVLCAMLMASRDVDGGIQWVRQQAAARRGCDHGGGEGQEPPSSGRSCIRRPWASSAWGPSALWWPTSRCPWEWTSTATTPSSPWTRPCGWTATSTW